MNIIDLPFNRLIGISSGSEKGGILSLSADPRYTNHLGTVHASALVALAEATSGAYLLERFSCLEFKVLPVVRRMEAKFRKPALGAVFSNAIVPPNLLETFLHTLTERGRALVEVHVDVFDEHGAHALTSKFEWFITRVEQTA